MEVSDHEVEPDGPELIQTVVSLTGLPEEWIHQELDDILERSGQSSSNVTLDQLRKAMLSYLEAIQSDLVEDNLAQSD